MSAQHTPGPWKACERGDYTDDGIVILGDDRRLAVVSREDDAQLIAAAPELLGALADALISLKIASRQLSEDHKLVLSGRGWGWKTIARAERSIAKASIAKASIAKAAGGEA